MTTDREIVAAGGVVWRRRAGSRSGVEVLLAHRPRYQDWTFPKGKTDPGEQTRVTAVREIAEETGLHVRLGAPLPHVRYRVAAGPKVVHYWTARVDRTTPGRFVPNREVDEVRWVRPRDANHLLSYAHDLELLEQFRVLRDEDGLRTRTIVVLRHAKAVGRAGFRGHDATRPLAAAGLACAEALVPLLQAYGVGVAASSPARRCVDTVTPFVRASGLGLVLDDRLAESASARETRRAVRSLVDTSTPVALCGHRPTLGDVLHELGVGDPGLAPGQAVVVHRREGRVVATELLG